MRLSEIEKNLTGASFAAIGYRNSHIATFPYGHEEGIMQKQFLWKEISWKEAWSSSTLCDVGIELFQHHRMKIENQIVLSNIILNLETRKVKSVSNYKLSTGISFR